MVVNCCVPQCNSLHGRDNVSFHCFPTANLLRTTWINKLQIGKKISKYMRVCSKHFADSDFHYLEGYPYQKQRLKADTVPSINLPRSSIQQVTDVKFASERASRKSKRDSIKLLNEEVKMKAAMEEQQEYQETQAQFQQPEEEKKQIQEEEEAQNLKQKEMEQQEKLQKEFEMQRCQEAQDKLKSVARIQFSIKNEMSEDETKKYPLKRTTSCCAIDCKNGRNSGISFFRLPKDKERCTKWLINSQRPDLLDKSAESLYRSGGRLCAVHFEDSQFYTPDRNKLKPDAVPTRFGEACLLYQSTVETRPIRESRMKRKVDNTAEEMPQRQLRSLSEDHGKFMENWNPETSNREARKMNRKIYSDSHRTLHHHDDKGAHIRSGKDLCDCLDEECPGCHYPCPKCKSPKCGHECRCNRRWIYEKIEIEGTDIVIKTPLKLN